MELIEYSLPLVVHGGALSLIGLAETGKPRSRLYEGFALAGYAPSSRWCALPLVTCGGDRLEPDRLLRRGLLRDEGALT
jgi:hypothetical protein